MHHNGDRTASGIRKINNTVKCFGVGCGVGPLGPVDLVIQVLRLKHVIEAAQWIADHFAVPELPPKKHLQHFERRVFQYGFESDIGLLVYSGLWAGRSPVARALVPVMLELAERNTTTRALSIQMSYMALGRYTAFHRRVQSRPPCVSFRKSVGWWFYPAAARPTRRPSEEPQRTCSRPDQTSFSNSQTRTALKMRRATAWRACTGPRTAPLR